MNLNSRKCHYPKFRHENHIVNSYQSGPLDEGTIIIVVAIVNPFQLNILFGFLTFSGGIEMDISLEWVNSHINDRNAPKNF